MYEITRSAYYDFAHYIKGHNGNCQNIHGHTWKFELILGSPSLDKLGMVIDFKEIDVRIFNLIKRVLDHSLLISMSDYIRIENEIIALSNILLEDSYLDSGTIWDSVYLHGIQSNDFALDIKTGERKRIIKVAKAEFNPSAERLASWLFGVTKLEIGGEPFITVKKATVYEKLFPVVSGASYSEDY